MAREHALNLAPILVCRVRASLGEFADQRMMRREMAHWIGGAGVASEREGLTAAAAEVFFPLRA